MPTNEEIDQLPAYLQQLADIGPDAVIVADLGVLSLVKKQLPKTEIHMSTQAGITNWAAACAAWELGAKRVVLAREMTLPQIATLRQKTPPGLELEAFVHGAMHYGISPAHAALHGAVYPAMPRAQGTMCIVAEIQKRSLSCRVGLK